MTELIKNTLFFSLENLFIPEAIVKKPDKNRIFKLFEKLSFLEKNESLNLIFLSGFSENVCFDKIDSFGISDFFNKKNIFCVNQKYLDKKEKVDREKYAKMIESNPLYKDDYFKQVIIQDYIKKNNIPLTNAVFVCHDVLTEAYYSTRFSMIDFVLVKQALSFRGKPFNKLIKGLNYINLNWHDLKKVIYGKIPLQDVSFLNSFVLDNLSKELFPDLKNTITKNLKGVKK